MRNENPKVNLDVVWTPGMRHPEFPHIVAYKEQGQWIPEAGFQFANPKVDLEVVRQQPVLAGASAT